MLIYEQQDPRVSLRELHLKYNDYLVIQTNRKLNNQRLIYNITYRMNDPNCVKNQLKRLYILLKLYDQILKLQ